MFWVSFLLALLSISWSISLKFSMSTVSALMFNCNIAISEDSIIAKYKFLYKKTNIKKTIAIMLRIVRAIMRFVCLLGCALTTILLGCSTSSWDYEAQQIREEQERINQAKPIVQEMADTLAPILLELQSEELHYQLRKIGVDPYAIRYYAEARRRILSGIPGESFERLDPNRFSIGLDADEQEKEYMIKCPGAWADYLLAKQVQRIRIKEDLVRTKDELRKIGGYREQEDSIAVGSNPLSVRMRTHLGATGVGPHRV